MDGTEAHADLGGGTQPLLEVSTCICGGTGGLVDRTVVTPSGPKDIVQVCAACRPESASRVGPVAQLHRHAGRQRRVALVR